MCRDFSKIIQYYGTIKNLRESEFDRVGKSSMKKETRLSLSPDTPRTCRPREFNLWKSQQIATGVCRDATVAAADPFSWWFPHK